MFMSCATCDSNIDRLPQSMVPPCFENHLPIQVEVVEMASPARTCICVYEKGRTHHKSCTGRAHAGRFIERLDRMNWYPALNLTSETPANVNARKQCR